MRVRFLSSYDRTFDRHLPKDQLKITQAEDTLLAFLASEKRSPKGLGLKKLRGNFWEVRVGRRLRILFEMEKNLLSFVIVGTHDEIKNFLKRV